MIELKNNNGRASEKMLFSPLLFQIACENPSTNTGSARVQQFRITNCILKLLQKTIVFGGSIKLFLLLA